MAIGKIGIEILCDTGPGILHATTGVIARHQGNITSVEIIEGGDTKPIMCILRSRLRAMRGHGGRT